MGDSPVAKSSEQSKKATAPKEGLQRRVNVLPVKGVLGKDVKAPQPLRAVGGYFKGAYQELRQVRWPSRKATWGLTLAVIVFTLVLVGFILALDYGFDLLFKKVIL